MSGSHGAHQVEGEVELFPQEGGWHHLRVPPRLSEEMADLADRGLIPVVVTMGGTTWETSLLPMGDGTHFVPLRAAVREREGIEVGDVVKAAIAPRPR